MPNLLHLNMYCILLSEASFVSNQTTFPSLFLNWDFQTLGWKTLAKIPGPWFCCQVLQLHSAFPYLVWTFFVLQIFYIYIFSVLSSLLGNIIMFLENWSTLKVYYASDIALMAFSFLKLTFAVSYSNFYMQSEAGKKLPFILVINLQVWSYLLVSCHLFEMSNMFSDLYFIFHYVVICYQNMLNLCNWSGARTNVHKMDLPDVYLSWTS